MRTPDEWTLCTRAVNATREAPEATQDIPRTDHSWY